MLSALFYPTSTHLSIFPAYHRGSRALLLSEHVPAALGEDAVASAHRVLGARDLAQEHGLQQDWRRREHRRVDYATGGGHDLAHATVDGVGVEDHVEEVEPHTTYLSRKKRKRIVEKKQFSGRTRTVSGADIEKTRKGGRGVLWCGAILE